MDAYAKGVGLGYLHRMSRTPAVFNPKAKWRLRFEDVSSPSADWSPNYKSARERSEFFQKKVAEDVANGRMRKLTYGEAKAKYGSRLLLGSLGVVEDGADKLRLIHDGSHHTIINHKIRARDHIPGPLVGDIAAELRDAERLSERNVGLVWDFASSHRIVLVHPEDWGLQACTLVDLKGKEPSDSVEVYLNTVGTFGFSTAGHWWGRLAAAVVRASHYFLGPSLTMRIMLFADDGKAAIPVQHFKKSIPALLGFMVSLGLDIKWAKIRGGTEFQWVGHWVCVRSARLGISESRRQWAVKWLEDLINGADTIAGFESGLGRLSFVCSAISLIDPIWRSSSPTRPRCGGAMARRPVPRIFLHTSNISSITCRPAWRPEGSSTVPWGKRMRDR